MSNAAANVVPTIPTTVRLPQDVHSGLNELKYERRTSAQQLVVQALREFLQREANESKKWPF